MLEPLKLAPLESLLPNGTSQLGPPACVCINKLWLALEFSLTKSINYKTNSYVTLTITVESLAAKAMISAQETVLGHSFSSADLILSITSNPRTEFLFGFELFSVIMLPLLSSNIDASQPCNFNNSLNYSSHDGRRASDEQSYI